VFVLALCLACTERGVLVEDGWEYHRARLDVALRVGDAAGARSELVELERMAGHDAELAALRARVEALTKSSL
jgi:hypothetical protein